jgi:hypothetical protein
VISGWLPADPGSATYCPKKHWLPPLQLLPPLMKMSCAFSGTAVGGPAVAVGAADGVALALALAVALALALGDPVNFGDGVPVGDEPGPTFRDPPPPEQATKAAHIARQSIARIIYGNANPLATSAELMVVAPEQGPVALHVLVTAPK